MKKIKNIFLAIGSLLLVSSCSDALDIVQPGEIYRDDAFKTVADLRKYLNGDVYTRVNNTEEIAFTSIFTDEVGIGPSNGGQDKELHRFQLNANSDEPAALWSNHYNVINRVNRLLEFADLVITTTPTDLAAKNAVLAEARALRAYSYIQLVSFFSVDPANPNALGVILSTTPDRYDLFKDRPRVSNQLIYDLIESDFTFAEANLAASATNYRNVTQKFISAARARMYLYRKDYVKAKQYATLATGALSTPNTYNGMWGDTAQGECIFAAARPTGGTWSNIASTWYFNLTTATGGAFLDMGRNLYNLYSQFPNDVRTAIWIDASAQINPNYAADINYVSNDILPINKYPGKGPSAPSAAQLRNDLKIFRNSEMVLILAECEVASSNLTAAATLVRSIRTARATGQPLPVYANAQAAWADILLERRKELAFEGHRYLDIKRLAALAGNQGITRDNTDDDILDQPLTLPLSDYRFTLPIPQLEVAGNVTIQQNPGY
jgi:starch-binding outer membrane protein, SusD/RagB family